MGKKDIDLNDVGEYAGRFFTAADFADNGTHRFQIAGWELHEFKDGSEKVAIELEGEKRQIALNKTNGRNIARGVGSTRLDDWVGVNIDVAAIDSVFAGKPVKSIRVTVAAAAEPTTKPPTKPPTQPPPTPAVVIEDDYIPF